MNTRTSKHQVLPPEEQEQIEKNLILNILTQYAIHNSVELIYNIIHEAQLKTTSYDLDLLISEVRAEYDKQEHEDYIETSWKKTEKKPTYENPWPEDI